MSTPTAPAPSMAQSIWLVTERDIAAKLQSKAFLISTAIMMLIALGGVIWGGFQAGSTSTTSVAVTAQTASAVESLSGVTTTTVDSAQEAEKLVSSGEVDAALIPSDGPLKLTVVAEDSAPDSLMAQLSVSPEVKLLNTDQQDALLQYLVAIGFGVVFLFSASMFGGTIASSVVEEKQTRVVEILISAIPVRALMAGKVIGNTIMAMAQIIALVAIAIIGLSVSGQGDVLGGLGAPMVWFAVFFLFGFMLLAALFAGAGALVSRQEDIGSTTMPVTALILAPYFLVIFFNDNPIVVGIMSYVPFSAPVAMPLRLFMGGVSWWEPLISLALLILTCAAAIIGGSRVYRNALLRMGARVKLSEALKG